MNCISTGCEEQATVELTILGKPTMVCPAHTTGRDALKLVMPAPIKKAAVSHGGGRPAAYKTLAGERVPGVTTICSRFKDAGGLIHWAWEQGRDGKDYRESRDEAGATGHLVHAWIDDSIHGRPLSEQPAATPEMALAAANAFAAFEDWREQVKLRIIDTERPLVSEVHRYGGTYDALALVAGKVTLLDWKSGNRVYSDHVIQVAAYRELLREHDHDKAPDSACLLRVDKQFGSFAYFSFPSEVLDRGWLAFERMRALFDIDKVLKKAVGA